MNRALAPMAIGLTAVATPALAHTGAAAAGSFMAGLGHPLGGPDHLLAMVAVGAWAALQGGRAAWLWPLVFVATMAAGSALGFAGIGLPLVEPGILASVVVLGLLVATAARLPVAAGAAIVGLFALAHGHAHGTEAPAAGDALGYGLGFALATAGLIAAGAGVALAARGTKWRTAVRAAGAALALGAGA